MNRGCRDDNKSCPVTPIHISDCFKQHDQQKETTAIAAHANPVKEIKTSYKQALLNRDVKTCEANPNPTTTTTTASVTLCRTTMTDDAKRASQVVLSAVTPLSKPKRKKNPPHISCDPWLRQHIESALAEANDDVEHYNRPPLSRREIRQIKASAREDYLRIKWYNFDDQNCTSPCKGWDGISRRCQCGNRRVDWHNGDNWCDESDPRARGVAY